MAKQAPVEPPAAPPLPPLPPPEAALNPPPAVVLGAQPSGPPQLTELETHRVSAARVDGPRPRAVVHDGADGITCRPPAARLDHGDEVVLGIWVGRHDKRRVTVLHGTPVLGLPAGILAALRATPGQRTGPILPAPPPAATA